MSFKIQVLALEFQGTKQLISESYPIEYDIISLYACIDESFWHGS